VSKAKRAALIVALVFTVFACERTDHSAAQKDSSARIRVVTLSPHLAELMFAAGAGDQVIGVSAYTDFPPEAAVLPIISDAFIVDQEQLALLDPDLLLAWENGTPAHVIDQLREAGFRVEVIGTNGLEDVASALEAIGRLTGNGQAAADAAARYREEITALRERHADAARIEVFYQIASRPLYTVNGTHYISELISLCGGHNIFDDLGDLAPMVDVEAVISRDPEAMLAALDSTQAAFDVWDRWPALAANRYGNRFFMPAAEIGRATPRLVTAGEAVCDALEQARLNKSEKSSND
jgi:iron complex transport system substrate-binding protein